MDGPDDEMRQTLADGGHGGWHGAFDGPQGARIGQIDKSNIPLVVHLPLIPRIERNRCRHRICTTIGAKRLRKDSSAACVDKCVVDFFPERIRAKRYSS